MPMVVDLGPGGLPAYGADIRISTLPSALELKTDVVLIEKVNQRAKIDNSETGSYDAVVV